MTRRAISAGYGLARRVHCCVDTMRSTTRLTIVTTLVLAACSNDHRPPPKPEPPPVKYPMPAVAPSSPGAAYFATRALGLTVLQSDGTFRHIPTKERWFRTLAPGVNGTAVACSLHECLQLKGAVVQRRWKHRSFNEKADAGPSKFDHVAVGKNGDLWTLDSTELAHFSAGRWQVRDTAKVLGKDIGSIQSIAADGKGGVWIATHKYLFERSGASWRKVVVAEKQPLWQAVVANNHGVVKALTFARKVYTLGDAKPAVATIGSSVMVSKLATGPKGELYVANSKTLFVTPAKGGLPTSHAVSKLKAHTGDIRAINVDDAGRVWIAADRGIHIMDRKGSFLTWKTGSIGQLNSPVDAILVLGGGPVLPKVGAVKTGGIAASVFRSGKPIAGATVEICTRPSGYLRRGQTPCSSSEWSRKTTTAANGTFRFSAVPLGVYGFAVKPVGDGKWTVSYTDFGAGMQAGRVMQIGRLRLRAKR